MGFWNTAATTTTSSPPTGGSSAVPSQGPPEQQHPQAHMYYYHGPGQQQHPNTTTTTKTNKNKGQLPIDLKHSTSSDTTATPSSDGHGHHMTTTSHVTNHPIDVNNNVAEESAAVAAAAIRFADLNGPVEGTPYYVNGANNNSTIHTHNNSQQQYYFPPGQPPQEPQTTDVVVATPTTATSPHAFGRDEMVTSSLSFFVLRFVLQVGCGVGLLGVYLYCAQTYSELYLIGLVAALGVAMLVQGLMRAWSVQQLQTDFLGQWRDTVTTTTEEGDSNTTRTTKTKKVATVRAAIVERYTNGFDPAATVAHCHARTTEHCACPSTTIPMTMTCDEEDAFDPYFHTKATSSPKVMPVSSSSSPARRQQRDEPTTHYQNMMDQNDIRTPQRRPPASPSRHRQSPYTKTTTLPPSEELIQQQQQVGFLYSIVVQYQVPVPKGYIRSDGHAIQSEHVHAVVLKEFKDVPPDLYYCSHVEMIYQTDEPKSAYAKPLLQHYAPKHQNGRISIGLAVIGVAGLMTLNAGVTASTVDLYATLANLILLGLTAFVVHHRAVVKHAATVRGEGARIVAWQDGQEQQEEQGVSVVYQ